MRIFTHQFQNMDDLVFEERNKIYGAYEIRKTESERVIQSTIMAICIMALFVGIPLLAGKYLSGSPPATKIKELLDDGILVVIEPPTKKAEQPAAETTTTVNKNDNLTKDNYTITDKKIEDDKVKVENPENKTTDASNNNSSGKPTDNGLGGLGTGKDTSTTITDNTTHESIEADVAPLFPGGEKALMNYLGKHLQYPEKAKEMSISGTVYMKFVVDEKGKVQDIEALTKVAGGCTEEAIRVIKNLPEWKAGIYKGKPAKVLMRIPIKFKLQN